MAWDWDAPTGVYKNHAMSKKIRQEAIADVRFMRFLTAEPSYGKGRGETVTITRILKLDTSGKVSEIARLPTARPTIQTSAVTVSEWGVKLELTEFEKNLTSYNLHNQYQKLLRDNMSLTMDFMAATALVSTPYLYIPVSTGGVFDTDGTASTTADVNLAIADLRVLHDRLHGTLKVPKFRNGNYVLVLTTNGARGIKNDPEYKDWLASTTSRPLITGQLPAVVEGFEIFETNNFDVLSNGTGTSSVLGEGIAFGEDPGFLAVVQNPELRAGLPEDLGRFRQTGWVGTLEAGLSWPNAAQARVIHITSA